MSTLQFVRKRDKNLNEIAKDSYHLIVSVFRKRWDVYGAIKKIFRKILHRYKRYHFAL